MAIIDKQHDHLGEEDWGLETLLIHAGQEPDPSTGAVVVPIYPSVTYAKERVEVKQPYTYARNANPTRHVLETILATLEKGTAACAFGSGMAAVTATSLLNSAGDHVLVSQDCYIGTYRLYSSQIPRFGIQTEFMDPTNLDDLRTRMRPNTRMIWIETPSNPRLRIVDIIKVVEIARDQGALVVADNTFASPYCQNPLDLGVDVVVHSTTKYLGGHSDLLGGAAITRSPVLAERLHDHQHIMGAVPSPFDCWLLIRGIKTLAVRMRQHIENAQAIAEFLHVHPKVAAVYYPGLPSHPGHEIARRQMHGGFSGMLSFDLKGGYEAAKAVVEHTRIFKFAVSLGGVESLVHAPGASLMADPERAARVAGTIWAENAGLIRVSVGLERKEDLIADLAQALDRA